MKMLTIIFLCILIAVPVPVLAQEVQELVLGVSPASVTPCVKAGKSDAVKFLISTNVDFPQNVTISFKGPKWANAENRVYFTNTHDLFVTVSVPEGTEEGIYNIQMLVCRLPDPALNESLLTEACVSPSIYVNVSSECPAWIGVDLVGALKAFLIAAIVVLVAMLALRRVSKIKARKR